jgi:predicted ATPase
MIRKFTYNNFCSFRDAGTYSMVTGAKTPTDNSFTPSTCGDQISVLSGIFGPNASGKTNLLKIVPFLNYLLRHSYHGLKPEDSIPVDGFFGLDQPTHLSIEFEKNSSAYRYEVTLTNKIVLEERLLQRNKSSGSFRTILHRKTTKKGIQIRQSESFTDITTLKQLLKNRPNASMMAAGLVTGRAEFIPVFNVLGLLECNVTRSGKREAHIHTVTKELIACARYFKENDHFLKEVEHRLKQADLGVSSFTIRDVEMVSSDGGGSEKVPFPFVTHTTDTGSFEIPMTQESSGTKRLFTLLRAFLPVLTEGGLAVIDEMESDLHPHLIPMLLDLFIDKETNPKRAQLIFTCHHVEVLNQLSKEQIYLVQKNGTNVSEATRLSDYKGVTRTENYFANYNAGRYDAIPEPELF